ncbi:nucleolus and neural progenitor protein-like [Clytia hemisphaerica]|uniref:nucleolus and neural progenitor protein-like n=1 Tax=Clytia hemisphaerica TaxID=252671 RepID=UPI0034D3DA3E
MLNKDVPLRQQRHPKYPDPSHDEVLWKDAKVETWRFHWRKLCITLKEMKSLSLKDEVSTLSKIVYKHHNQMKRDKSFQLLKKISTLSQRFQTMELFPQLNKYQDILNSFLKRKALISNKLLIPKEEFTIIIVEQLLGAVKLLEKFKYILLSNEPKKSLKKVLSLMSSPLSPDKEIIREQLLK